MRIECPSCAAQYDVPAARLKPGKLVRCARCASEWVPTEEVQPLDPPPEEAEPPAVDEFGAMSPEPQLTAMDRLAASKPALPSRPAGLTAAWVLTFVVLAGAVGAAI